MKLLKTKIKPSILEETSYRTVLLLNAQKESAKLQNHVRALRSRQREIDQVNPLINTFELLHLQEIALLTKKSNRKQSGSGVKNKE